MRVPEPVQECTWACGRSRATRKRHLQALRSQTHERKYAHRNCNRTCNLPGTMCAAREVDEQMHFVISEEPEQASHRACGPWKHHIGQDTFCARPLSAQAPASCEENVDTTTCTNAAHCCQSTHVTTGALDWKHVLFAMPARKSTET